MEIFLIPIMTGLFGWVLIWLLAKCLFFPIKPIQLGGFKWESGLKPLMEHFPFELIMLNDKDSDAYFKSMQPLMEEKLDYFFNHTIKEKLPMMSMFIGEKTVTQLKSVFLSELANIFPQIIEQFVKNGKTSISNTFITKLSDKLAPIIMNAIKPMQWAAFTFGICWGALIVFIIHLF